MVQIDENTGERAADIMPATTFTGRNMEKERSLSTCVNSGPISRVEFVTVSKTVCFRHYRQISIAVV